MSAEQASKLSTFPWSEYEIARVKALKWLIQIHQLSRFIKLPTGKPVATQGAEGKGGMASRGSKDFSGGQDVLRCIKAIVI